MGFPQVPSGAVDIPPKSLGILWLLSRPINKGEGADALSVLLAEQPLMETIQAKIEACRRQ
jgi:hypothetical protein